jgi:REP element-mobilizing transposase RayT
MRIKTSTEKGQSHLRKGRWTVEGAFYFITTTTVEHTPFPNLEVSTRIIFDSLSHLSQQGDIHLICCVVMPDHVHLVFPDMGQFRPYSSSA